MMCLSSWSSSSESEEDFDNEVACVLSTIEVLPTELSTTTNTKRRWGGSMLGRKPNKKRKMDDVIPYIDEMYYCCLVNRDNRVKGHNHLCIFFVA